MVYTVRLSYAFRTGTLTGVAGRRLVHLLARSTPDHIAAWEMQQEFRAGKWTPCDYTFVPPGGHEALGRVLRVSPANRPSIAGRSFTGACDTANIAHALFVDDGAGGCCIHDWPPCRCARCIVVPHGLGDLSIASGSIATLTIVA